MSVYTDQKESLGTEDIEEAARVRLRHSHYRAIRNVECYLEAGGVLNLRGSVPTYHYKQLAQTAVAEVAGVQSIINEIEVDSTP